MSTATEWAAGARKFLTYLAGVLGQVIALGLLHGAALRDVQIAVAVITGVLLYRLRNGGTEMSLGEDRDPTLPVTPFLVPTGPRRRQE